MEHGAYIAQLMGSKTLYEFALVEVIGDIAVRQVTALVAVSQVVDGDDVALAAPVKRLHQIAADKPGSPGHDDAHLWQPPGTWMELRLCLCKSGALMQVKAPCG